MSKVEWAGKLYHLETHKYRLHMHKHIFKSIQITGSNKMDIRDGLHHVNDPRYRGGRECCPSGVPGCSSGPPSGEERAAAGVKTVMSVRADIWDYGMGTADLSQKITIALHLAINILMCRGENVAWYLTCYLDVYFLTHQM